MELLKILKVNLRYNFLPHLIIAIIIALLTPVLFNINSLSERAAAQPIELLLSFTGTILLTPIFLPEQNPNIRDVIRSKRFDYFKICMVRVAYSILAIILINLIFVMNMKYHESAVNWQHFVGGCASAIFMGVIGFVVAGFSGNVVSGYMASIIFYVANIGLKKELGVFYIFSMSMGGDFTIKYWLLFFSFVIILAVFALFYKCKIFRIKRSKFLH